MFMSLSFGTKIVEGEIEDDPELSEGEFTIKNYGAAIKIAREFFA